MTSLLRQKTTALSILCISTTMDPIYPIGVLVSPHVVCAGSTETPRKLKYPPAFDLSRGNNDELDSDNQAEEAPSEDGYGESTPYTLECHDWARRACFSPRPKGQHPPRRPLRSFSWSSSDPKDSNKMVKRGDSFRCSNQQQPSALERIQEDEDSDEEAYESDEENEEQLQLYKSLSGNLFLNRRAVEDEDNDTVCI